MNNQEQVNSKANKFLGKQLNDYDLKYDPNLLVPIERSLNRQDYQITDEDFKGFDIWHNYECSFMTDNGYPISVIGKIKIPSNSKYFIESKSMKLYFFSFHLEKFGKTKKQAIENYKKIVKKDLSEKTQSTVEFEIFEDTNVNSSFSNFINVEELIDINAIEFNEFKENPDLIKQKGKGEIKLRFNNVRSNCRVTHQPDFANLFIHIKGNLPDITSLLKYVVSFRNEYHFHEEVTEQIFKILKTKLNPEDLMVCNLFTRRGGLDICPCRTTNIELIDKNFLNINLLPEATPYQ